MELERRCIDFDELPECELTLEARANGTQVLTGYAAVYNRLSLPLREGGSAFREVIRPGAFDRILTRQRGKQDVVALLNHDSNMILGRTSSGTLELSSDDKGLRYTVTQFVRLRGRRKGPALDQRRTGFAPRNTRREHVGRCICGADARLSGV
jgi:phage head maturation protease